MIIMIITVKMIMAIMRRRRRTIATSKFYYNHFFKMYSLFLFLYISIVILIFMTCLQKTSHYWRHNASCTQVNLRLAMELIIITHSPKKLHTFSTFNVRVAFISWRTWAYCMMALCIADGIYSAHIYLTCLHTVALYAFIGVIAVWVHPALWFFWYCRRK